MEKDVDKEDEEDDGGDGLVLQPCHALLVHFLPATSSSGAGFEGHGGSLVLTGGGVDFAHVHNVERKRQRRRRGDVSC